MTQTERQVLQALKELPPDKRAQALDFVQFLKSRSGRKAGRRRANIFEMALLTRNPSFDFLRDEPDLYE